MSQKGELTRRNIKEQAMKLFVKRGFKDVTMKDICEATQLSRGGLYLHYGSTRQIFAEIIDDLMGCQEDEFSEKIEQGLSAKEILLQVLERYKNAIGQPVQVNMRMVSNYILTELSPALLGFQAGVEESRSIMEHTVGELDNYLFNLLELMTREAVKLKLSKFIASYYGLTVKEANNLVEKVLPPKQREVVVPVPVDSYARREEHKSVKKDQG